jgi:hypothetical protein
VSIPIGPAVLLGTGFLAVALLLLIEWVVVREPRLRRRPSPLRAMNRGSINQQSIPFR